MGATRMDDPMRVLVVEHRHAACWIAEQLLADYELDFSWQCAKSPLELRQIAAEFDPNIVLCTDDVSMTSSRAVLDALRLLCSQTPVILVSSVCEADVGAARDATLLVRKTARQPFEGARDHSVPDTAPLPGVQDIAHLRRSFSSLLDSSSDPAAMSNADGWITHANVSACRRLDASCERSLGTLLGAPFEQGAHESHRTDISHRLAYFDAWTRQPTMIHTHDLIGCVTARADGCGSALALVALDLDSVRIPDERLPPPDGADMQCEVARYASMVRIAHDDFLWVLPHLSSAADAADVVQRVLESIAHTCLGVGLSPPLTGAADIVPVPANGRIASLDHSSLRRQDRRPSRPVVERRPAVQERSRLEASLGDALQRHALSIQYQPQFELHTGRGCGVEALARWTLCTGQIIAPSVFIPLAERIGMIHALGAWVLKSACETAYAWCSRDAQRTTLSVNVSALQINEQFCTVIQRTLKDSGFPAKHLELEITESALIGHADRTIECLKQWKRLGVQIAVDDFGTGYSSLNYLSRLPVDRLKLDQSLIQRMTLDAKSATVMRSIISLGADLGIDVIAEGVETEQQLRMLEDLGCPRVQGFLLGRPMPPKQAQIALRKAWGNRPSPAYRPSKIASGEARVQ
jgi:EAL domain-containing protein (putative c-di-GMP-specific phosphodiesterase class I)/PAS domain-containing protein